MGIERSDDLSVYAGKTVIANNGRGDGHSLRLRIIKAFHFSDGTGFGAHAIDLNTGGATYWGAPYRQGTFLLVQDDGP